MIEFGDMLKNLRLNYGITQENLGKELCISPSTIGMYEQKRRLPDIATIIKIASFFEVSTDYLLLGENIATFSLNEKELEWLKLYRSIPLDKRDDCFGYVKVYSQLNQTSNKVSSKKIVG